MKATVYLETSIPSFFYETRSESEFIAMRDWTKSWWLYYKDRYQCFTSDAVVAESTQGNFPKQREKLELMEGIEQLEITQTIQEIVDVYIENYLMPKNHLGDALHLAIASFYKMDFLLTWNCTHLANANKRAHIRRINGKLRIFTPELVTPYDMLEDE